VLSGDCSNRLTPNFDDTRLLGYPGFMSWYASLSNLSNWRIEQFSERPYPNFRWFRGICALFHVSALSLRSRQSYSQAVSFYKGKALPPWKIIYVLLGGLAIVVGICVLIWLPDSPVHAHMLTQEERIAALERVRDDQGGTENKTIKRDQIIETLLDIRTWLVVLTTMLSMSFSSYNAVDCL
jgi:hypothetical protein